MAEWDEMVVVGRIARAHGIRGQVIVDPVTDFPDERFKPGSVLYRRKRRVRGSTVVVGRREADARGGRKHGYGSTGKRECLTLVGTQSLFNFICKK